MDIRLVLALLTLLMNKQTMAHPEGAPAEACHDMKPQHPAILNSKVKVIVEKQPSDPPYTISVSSETHSEEIREITVILKGPPFRGFLLQAQMVTDHDIQVGHFEPAENTQFLQCGEYYKGTVTHTDRFRPEDHSKEQEKHHQEKHNFTQTIVHTEHHPHNESTDGTRGVNGTEEEHHETAEQSHHHNNTKEQEHHNTVVNTTMDEDEKHHQEKHNFTQTIVHEEHHPHNQSTDGTQGVNGTEEEHHETGEQSPHHNNTKEQEHHNTVVNTTMDKEEKHHQEKHNFTQIIVHTEHHPHNESTDGTQGVNGTEEEHHETAEQSLHHNSTKEQEHHNTVVNTTMDEDAEHHSKPDLTGEEHVLKLLWHSGHSHEDVIFRATVVQHRKVYWTGIKSAIVKYDNNGSISGATSLFTLLLLAAVLLTVM